MTLLASDNGIDRFLPQLAGEVRVWRLAAIQLLELDQQ
jgi:hypothetical protein